MAGWGTGSFENDDAQTWLGLLKSLTIDDLKQSLTRAADQPDYLGAPESSIAVATAETIAALKGAPAEAAPREIVDWVALAQPDGSIPQLAELAVRAVRRVRANSELKDLWLEAEGLNEWSTALRELEKRLSS
jgi:hypothetical protein